jgi:hypothetical protein
VKVPCEHFTIPKNKHHYKTQNMYASAKVYGGDGGNVERV